MAKEKEEKYRVNAYVNLETYQKLMDLQMKEKIVKNKKVSQGQILEKIFKDVKVPD